MWEQVRGQAGLWATRAKHLAPPGVDCAAHEARQETESGETGVKGEVDTH